jgi:hypothetical protein
MVYAGAETKGELNKFYERVREKIPEGARGVKFTPPKPYNSQIVLPTVSEFVSTLTAGELGKGIDVIAGLGKEVKLGFAHLGTKLDGLPPKMGESVINALKELGYIQETKKEEQ